MENRNQSSQNNRRPVPPSNRRPVPPNRDVRVRESNLHSSNTGVKTTGVKDAIPMPPPKKKKKMSVGLKVLLSVLISLAVIILAVVVYFVGVLTLYKPQSNSSELPSFLQGIAGGEGNGENEQQTPPAADDSQYNFLVVARDKVSGLTDVMMIIN